MFTLVGMALAGALVPWCLAVDLTGISFIWVIYLGEKNV